MGDQFQGAEFPSFAGGYAPSRPHAASRAPPPNESWEEPGNAVSAHDPMAAAWEGVQQQMQASLDALSGYSRDARATSVASLSTLHTSMSGLTSRFNLFSSSFTSAAERLAVTTKEMGKRLDQHYQKLDVLAASAATAEKRANDMRSAEIPKAIADAQAATRIAIDEAIDADTQRVNNVIAVMQGRLDKEREERAAEQQRGEERRKTLEAMVAKLAGAVREQELRSVALEAAIEEARVLAATGAEDQTALARRMEEHVRSSAAAREADHLQRREADAAASAAAAVAITLSESDTRYLLKKETEEREALAARVITRAEVDAAIADSASAAAAKAKKRAEAAATTVQNEMIAARTKFVSRLTKHDEMLQKLTEQNPAVNKRLDNLEILCRHYADQLSED
jgi:hypothetical protein